MGVRAGWDRQELSLPPWAQRQLVMSCFLGCKYHPNSQLPNCPPARAPLLSSACTAHATPPPRCLLGLDNGGCSSGHPRLGHRLLSTRAGSTAHCCLLLGLAQICPSSWAPSDLGLARPVCPPTSLHCARSGQIGFFGKSERGQSPRDRTPAPSPPASPSEAWLALSRFPARCGLGFFVLGAGRNPHLRASWWEQTQSALGMPQGQTGASH